MALKSLLRHFSKLSPVPRAASGLPVKVILTLGQRPGSFNNTETALTLAYYGLAALRAKSCAEEIEFNASAEVLLPMVDDIEVMKERFERAGLSVAVLGSDEQA